MTYHDKETNIPVDTITLNMVRPNSRALKYLSQMLIKLKDEIYPFKKRVGEFSTFQQNLFKKRLKNGKNIHDLNINPNQVDLIVTQKTGHSTGRLHTDFSQVNIGIEQSPR